MSEKKVAIVTGAAQGIGFASAKKFSEQGWAVALVDLNPEELKKAVTALQELHFDADGFVLDVSNFDEGKATVAKIIARFGRVDALFNNAGIIGHRPNILTCDPVEIKRATDVNVFGSLYMTQHVAKYWVENKIKGAVVNVASIAAELASWDPFGYQISKYGVKGLTKATAFQLGSFGIRVNAVAPGSTRTPMAKIDWSNPTLCKATEESTLLHMWLEPEDIANAAYFLASDLSRGMTGHIMVVDAGYSIAKVNNRENIYGEQTV